MRGIHLHTIGKSMSIDCNFIEHYMPAAAPVYALVYIYTLGRCQSGEDVSALKLAEIFRIRKSEVFDAWRYWESAGLVQLKIAESEREQEEIASITFLPVPFDSTNAVEPVPELESETVPEPLPEPKKLPATERPKYCVEELTLYREQSAEIAHLFSHAEKTLVKMLTYNDLSILFGFHDWLRMSVDLIVYMLDYCAANDHRDLRYIEKVALDWAERGIASAEEAADYTANFDKKYRRVMAALGAGNSFPSPTQRKYMDKWLNEWQMPVELILDACDKAAVQIGKPKLTYVDKILNRWQKDGIKTPEEVAADAEVFAAKSVAEKSDGTKRLRRNRFANFKPRERDYELMERLEREYQIKSLQAQGVKV